MTPSQLETLLGYARNKSFKLYESKYSRLASMETFVVRLARAHLLYTCVSSPEDCEAFLGWKQRPFEFQTTTFAHNKSMYAQNNHHSCWPGSHLGNIFFSPSLFLKEDYILS